MKSVCVFCGSHMGGPPVYRSIARELGAVLAGLGLRLVYGGGGVGLMGVVADAVLETGGEVVGVIPRALATRELAHAGVTELHVVGSMHERKALMADLSDGFIALPGGFGTLDELCEIITWAQLGIHRKPCGILNINGYFDDFLRLLDRAVADGFIRAEHRRIILEGRDPVGLLDELQRAPSTRKRPAKAAREDQAAASDARPPPP